MSLVPHLDITIDIKSADATKKALYTVTNKLFGIAEELSAGERAKEEHSPLFTVKKVSGGITNALFKVSVESKIILVRVFGAKTDIIIDRKTEYKTAVLLGREGFGPKIYGTFTNGRLEEWIDAVTCEPKDLTDKTFVPRIASQLARMHKLSIDMDKSPSLFVTLRKWLQMAIGCEFQGEKKRSVQALELSKFHQELGRLETTLLAIDSPVVFCHNDLLSGNVMSSEQGKILHFIDFEYSNYNYAYFDIANHFCECCGFDCDWKVFPKEKEQFTFFRAYLATLQGVKPETISTKALEALYRKIQPWVLASHFYWGFWAVVQGYYSMVDFNYVSYAEDRLKAYWDMKKSCLAASSAL